MGISFRRVSPVMSDLVADRRLFLTTAKDRVVEEGDPAAAFLLVTPGTPILATDVERYGLTEVKGRIHLGGTVAKEPEPKAPPNAAKPKRSGQSGKTKAR